jgi:hypothetical protein
MFDAYMKYPWTHEILNAMDEIGESDISRRTTEGPIERI